MALSIVKYGDPVLIKKASLVTEFDDELKQLTEEMLKVMYAESGVGLAAPQVAMSKRIFVMDCSKNHSRQYVLINPEIISTDGKQKGQEGCLSFPGIFFDVERPKQLIIRAQDIEGNFFTLDLCDLEARCASHETDHLDGELFINRVGPLKRDLIKTQIRKKIKSGNW